MSKLIVKSSHSACMYIEAFPRTLFDALAVASLIEPRTADDTLTLSTVELLDEDRADALHEIEMDRWLFQFIGNRWILTQTNLVEDLTSVGPNLGLYEEQIRSVLLFFRDIGAPVHIGDAGKEANASYVLTLPGALGPVFDACQPADLVEPSRQYAEYLGYAIF